MEEESQVYKECLSDLLKLLKRKFNQGLTFGCYLAKPKNKKEFIDSFSLSQIVFILGLHGLFNEDLALSAIVAEILQNKMFYKELGIYTPDFEFWVRRTFYLNDYQVKPALEYSTKIRHSHLFQTPKSIYRILCGYISRVRLRTTVRDLLYNSRVQEEKEDRDQTFESSGTDVLAIASAEVVGDIKDNETLCSSKMLFLKKEPTIELETLEKCKQWLLLKEKFQVVLKPKVLSSLQFACQSSIYTKEFTLKHLEPPFRRQFILWLYGLLHQDSVLLSLSSNWFSFSIYETKSFPPSGFENWVKSSFIFSSDRSLSSARLLFMLKINDLLYIQPILEEIFVNLPFIQSETSCEFSLKDVVEGKEPKTKKKKNNQMNPNDTKDSKTTLSKRKSEERTMEYLCNQPNEQLIESESIVLINSEQNNKILGRVSENCEGQLNGITHKVIEAVEVPQKPRGITHQKNKRIKIQAPDKSGAKSTLTCVDANQVEEREHIYSHSSNNGSYYLADKEGESLLECEPYNYIQTYPLYSTYSQMNYGVTDAYSMGSSCFKYLEKDSPVWGNYFHPQTNPISVENEQHQSMMVHKQSSFLYPLTSHEIGNSNFEAVKPNIEHSHGDPKGTPGECTDWNEMNSGGPIMNECVKSRDESLPLTEVSNESVPIQIFHRSTLPSIGSERKNLSEASQNMPDVPPHPLILTKKNAPSSSTAKMVENEDNCVEAILRQVEEKDRIIQKALLNAAANGNTETLSKLVAACGTDLISRAGDNSTGKTLLHIASENDHESAVEYLIQYGCLNSKDHNGMTPLHIAVLHGRATIVEILLESGADASIRDNEGKTAYETAISLGKKRLADKITKLTPP